MTAPHLAEQARERISEILADGKWHLYEKVRSEVVRLVPPGIAIRRAEANRATRLARYRHGPPDERSVQRTPEELVRFGARDLVRVYLKNAIAGGQVESVVDDGIRKIRLVPSHEMKLEGSTGNYRAFCSCGRYRSLLGTEDVACKGWRAHAAAVARFA